MFYESDAISNRAEGPVRNLLCGFARVERALCPLPLPLTPAGNGTTTVAPQSIVLKGRGFKPRRKAEFERARLQAAPPRAKKDAAFSP
jgi:hypothetical protein